MKPWWALLLFVPLVAGGTADDPDIVDDADDTVREHQAFSAPAADIVAAWVVDDEEGLHVSIQADDDVCAPPLVTIQYRMFFHDVTGKDMSIGADVVGGQDVTQECPGNSAQTVRTAAGSGAVNIAGDVITFTMDPAFRNFVPPGPLVAYMTTLAQVSNSLIWKETDRAPDSGSATIPLEVPPPEASTAYQTVNSPVLQVAGNATDPRNGTLQVNWTAGPADAEMILHTNITAGVLNVTLTDANASLVFSCLCNGTRDELFEVQGAPGNWTLVVTFQGMVGLYDIQAAPAPTVPVNGSAAPPSDPTQSPPNGTQQENATQPPGKDSPWHVAGVLVAVAAVAWLRRRSP